MSGVTVADAQPIDLSPEQSAASKEIIAAARARKPRCFYVTGPAGTGKSTVLNEIRKSTRTLVCAPTGIAAINVGGSTIHSLFGFGTAPKTKSQVRGYFEKSDVFDRAELIVIDEVSMVRADLLDRIDACLQRTLQSSLPFGGKTVALFGDSFQLEPVVRDESAEAEFIYKHYRSKFWFDAQVFDPSHADLFGSAASELRTIELSEVFRQRGDSGFLDALNAIRIGDPSGLRYFDQCVDRTPSDAVSITFTNAKADQINAERLDELPFDSIQYVGQSAGDVKDGDLPVPQEIHLKVGARVMFAKNIHGATGYIANGTIGKVVGFYQGLPLVQVSGGVELVDRVSWKKVGYTFDKETKEIREEAEGDFTQIPLKPAYGITSHKSQGQTLDAATLTLETKARSHGQLYVSLSRVRTIDGLRLRRKLTARDINVNPRVQEFMTDLKAVDLEAFAA